MTVVGGSPEQSAPRAGNPGGWTGGLMDVRPRGRRLDGDGVWLVRNPGGAPWELSTSGGMSGPRSYACVDAAARPGREVQAWESEREGTAETAPTYVTTTRTWGLTGHGVELLETRQATGVDPEQVALDPATC